MRFNLLLDIAYLIMQQLYHMPAETDIICGCICQDLTILINAYIFSIDLVLYMMTVNLFNIIDMALREFLLLFHSG